VKPKNSCFIFHKESDSDKDLHDLEANLKLEIEISSRKDKMKSLISLEIFSKNEI
jgi:hypothetical protein